MNKYRKAITALLGPVISVLVLVNVLPAEFNTPEVVGAITLIINTVLVWAIPNEQA